MRILIIEDDKKTASFISRGLKEELYTVDLAHRAEEGLFLADVNSYDLIVLDVMLPDKDGFSVCKELRDKGSNVPVLMLTCRSDIKDRIMGLNTGADDYLGKPFSFDEFLARVGALLRRKGTEKNTVIKAGDLELDQLKHTVKRAGKDISLTNKEYSVLEYLMLHAGQVVTRTMLSEHSWDQHFDSNTNIIDVYVNHLRKKISQGFKKNLISTVRGRGYILKG